MTAALEADEVLSTQIRSKLEADGVLLATIDMPGRSMNVFSVELMDALDALMDRVDTDPAVRCVVLTSGKPAFLAGADLDMVRGYTVSARSLDADALFALCGRLGRQFVRLEASAKPWVAAVNGIAMGGGLELAMACRARLVTDDPRTQLSLPEVRWGLLPGAGGTQRLPRLVGFEAGLSLLLTGRSMDPKEAVSRGVFKAAVPAERLLDEARALARSLHDKPFDAVDKFNHLAQADVPPHTPETVRALARRHGIGDADFRDYPAFETIIDCVLRGARQPLAEATATEMRQFLRLMIDPVAGQMVRTLFLNRQRADRELAAPAGLRIQGIAVGPLSTPLAPWNEVLAQSRLPLHQDASLPPDTVVLSDSQGHSHSVRIGTLDSEPLTSHGATVEALLTPAGPYGRVLDIVKATPSAALALASLAPRLGGALPYRSADGTSVLRRLARAAVDSLDAQSLVAVGLLASGAATKAETLDVAACAAGLTPAWTGGPLAHFWTHRERLQAQLDPQVLAAWPRLEPVLRTACA
jgi:3-hydroxyacyl-CoA dehydrogenase / enoyl-CoA hydratase / 3-hydroxybutyryl-CoA epimerase